MKKFISIALITAMIATMGVTAFAKSNGYTYDDSDVTIASQRCENYYDNEVYFPLYVNNKPITDDEAVGTLKKDRDYVYFSDIEDFDTLKVSVKFNKYAASMAPIALGDVVFESCTIDTVAASEMLQNPVNALRYERLAEKGLGGDDPDVWVVALKFREDPSYDKMSISGTLKLKKKNGGKVDDFDFMYTLQTFKAASNWGGQESYLDLDPISYRDQYAKNKGNLEDAFINLTEYNNKAGHHSGTSVDGKFEYGPTYQKLTVADFKLGVTQIELEDDYGFHYIVPAQKLGKVNVVYDNNALPAVIAVAPADADLSFYNFYGRPNFIFYGTATIALPEEDTDYYLYEVGADGSITASDAVLNEDGDAFEFRASQLGCYVLSDKELPVTVKEDPNAPADDTEGTTANPGTGGAPALKIAK